MRQNILMKNNEAEIKNSIRNIMTIQDHLIQLEKDSIDYEHKIEDLLRSLNSKSQLIKILSLIHI